jgi:hypothetical protein
MKIIILTALAFLSSNFVFASDQFEKLYLFTEDVRDIIIKSPEGNPLNKKQFDLSNIQSDQIKAISELDNSTRNYLDTNYKKDCDQKKFYKSELQSRIEKRDLQIDTLIISSNAKFEQNVLGQFMGDDYMNFMGNLYATGNKKASDIYSIQSLTSKYKSLNPNNNWDKLTFIEKEKTLTNFANTYLNITLPKGLVMKELAFSSMIDNSTNWKTILETAKDNLTYDQKVQLVSKFGGFFGNHYNFSRFEAGEKARGEYVTTEQLLNSLKTGSPGGICRDIALAQTQMLQELGFKNSYVVSYKTLQGAHSTALTTDPETGKIIKFNYSEANESKAGSGTEALMQDTSLPDHGLGFRLYDTSGKPITHVPSEMAQMLRDSTGVSFDRNFNSKNYNLVKVGFNSEGISGSLFTGKTSSGDNLYGIALYNEQKINEHLKMGTGLSISKLDGKRSLMQIDQDNLYVRNSIEANYPLNKTANSETKIIGGASIEALLSNNREIWNGTGMIKEAKREIDANSDGFVGIQNKYISNDKRTEFNTEVYANLYPDWNHVASGDKTVAVLDGVTIHSGISHEITENKRAMIENAIIMKNYGSSMVTRAALEDTMNGSRYVAGFSTPITKDMPTFLPGGERKVMLGLEKVKEKMTFSIEYERNLENRNSNLMIKGKVNF